jgi:hypothetical protein
LGSLGTDSSGFTLSAAVAINSGGTAVGYARKFASDFDYTTHAVRWSSSGTGATELGSLSTDSGGLGDSYAYAINTAGTAVGYAGKWLPQGARAVRWDTSGAATELGNLGTDSSGSTGGTGSSAVAVNTAGTAVGFAEKWVAGIDQGQRAVRWDASGTAVTELENLGTDSSGFATGGIANAINTAGIAVGSAEKYDSGGTFLGYGAVAWRLDGSAIDLNTLLLPDSGWKLEFATGISDTNLVSGYGQFDPDGPGPQDTYERPFLLDVSSAVPEPGLSSLFVIAAALSLLRRARARTRSKMDLRILRP